MDARKGNSSMYNQMIGFGITNSFSSLTPRAGTRNPDDAYSRIPYEKGYQFLLYLESLDGEVNFQKFLNKWITKFSKQSVDTDDLRLTFEQHLYDSYTSTKAKDIIKKIDWTTWIDAPGLPPVTANFTT